MPKMSKAKAKAVAKAESSGFEPLPEGRYVGTLKQVIAEKNGQPLIGAESGEPYWQWEFEKVTSLEDGKTYPGRQFVITSLSDSADWKMKEVFDAFGYEYDSDTDEMIGEKVILVISQRPIGKGPRKGEIGNQVDRVLPYDEDEYDDDDWGADE